MRIDFENINFLIRGFKKREPILFEKIKKVFPEIENVKDQNNIPELPETCVGIALDHLYNTIKKTVPDCYYTTILDKDKHPDVFFNIYQNGDKITLSLENNDCFVSLDLGYYTVSCNFTIERNKLALMLVVLILAINKAREVERDRKN